MMTITRRPLALLCALLMLLSLVSCAASEGEEVPANMQIASCAGADYRLYVPTSWVPNTSYGISGAYRDLSNQSTVSVQSYLKADYNERLVAEGVDLNSSGDRLEGFWSLECLAPVMDRALDGQVTAYEEECVATSLDGVNAVQYHYSALIGGVTYELLQVVADGAEKYYVFTFMATKQMFELYRTEVDQMLTSFVFADPYVPVDYAKYLDKGENAPAGMKPAFGDDVAYCFYVPESWTIRLDESIYAAHVPADMTSVSVVPYMPASDQISVEQYFKMTEDMMKKLVRNEGDYKLLASGEKVELGGKQATVYEFAMTVSGVEYHYRQYIAAYKSMIYAVTYTATGAAYELHLAELEQIVAAFQFR